MEVIKDFYCSKKLMYIASASANDELNKIAEKLEISHLFKDILGSPRNKIDSVKEILERNKFIALNKVILIDVLKKKISS